MHLATFIVIAGLLTGIFIVTRRKSTSLPLPPGPKPLPIIGNVHQAPKSHGWNTYREWSKQYGPIVHLNMLGQHVIILSTSELATELALKGLNILMMNYTEQFRQHQRLQVSVLNATPAAAYLPLQTLESQQLLQDLLENAGGAGAEVQGHFQRAVASIIHTLLYGFRVKDYNDPVLRTVVNLNDEFSQFVQVGAHIVDQFPVLNNLPGFLAPWQAKAEKHYTTKHDLRGKNFRRGLESDTWNISKHLKKAVEKDGLDMPLKELAFELGTMIDAALDGTTDSLLWFVVACVTQDQGFVSKAHEELDAVVGHGRLPVLDDKQNMPYITAIVEEIFRWRPVGPEGVPHLNKEETTYNGYTIPKGSVIIPNVWTISREEALFGPDPDDFIPDRWLDENGKTLKDLPAAGFGYGRRTCPGRYFARNFIWTVVAQVLWSFDIKAGLSEETGEPVVVDPFACSYGLVMRALPFKASFNPRGPWVREVIARNGDTYSKDHMAMLSQIGAEFAKL
ncbi:hypothetical protein N7491_009252 [Penicillium cf. griseofulvum]|uniref:Cytochrome P450 n=1 Tax=Penicillium cf. griseofulvum TaxID=2972120 RepID=A0A9W9JT23_9EURO|nr:hypothetical protein N7472_005154 [Penicillium cf. griseofulvum]KAJ5424036.1 hypothetical protein N7491_009252 [Penicillium cf. griseofulvum]